MSPFRDYIFTLDCVLGMSLKSQQEFIEKTLVNNSRLTVCFLRMYKLYMLDHSNLYPCVDTLLVVIEMVFV